MILFRYKTAQQSIIKHTENFNTASLTVLNSHEALKVSTWPVIFNRGGGGSKGKV